MPIPVPQFRKLVLDLDPKESTLPFKLALLFMFYAGLRQSEVAPSTVHKFDPSRNLTRSDIILGPTAITFSQKWAKNLQHFNQSHQKVLEMSPDPRLCPVITYRQLLSISPTTHGDQPFLTFRSDGNTVTISFLNDRVESGHTAAEPPATPLHPPLNQKICGNYGL